ncbi:DUF624 domain-containing protein [Rhodophyticola sp. CCM32]|uniref:DUF624 domain-containing protein n=1 Tax=Rhodophyticola sp. CCM32 TaxID=2916397 RepID=UPI001EE550FC|nr:DUF624 domain-containing protein [Rhodophyticola sp. CCM32]
MQGFVVLFTTRIWQMTAINLVTIGLALAGLGLFGFAPALAACLWATRRIEDETVAQIVPGMWREYRREFLTLNAFALPHYIAFAVIGALLAMITGIATSLLLTALVFVALSLLAGIVVKSCLSGGIADTFVNAKWAMALAPYRLLLSLAVLPVLILVTAWQPLVGLYFGLSAWAVLISGFVIPGIEAGFPNASEKEALS